MNGAQQMTQFAGLARTQPAEYQNVATTEEATDAGTFEKTNTEIRKPWRLVRWKLPPVKLPIR